MERHFTRQILFLVNFSLECFRTTELAPQPYCIALFQLTYDPVIGTLDDPMPSTSLATISHSGLGNMLPVPLSNIKEEDMKIDVTTVPQEMPIRVYSVNINFCFIYSFLNII